MHGKNYIKNKHINNNDGNKNNFMDYNNANKQMLIKKLTYYIESIPKLSVKIKEKHIDQIEEIADELYKMKDIKET